VVREPISEQFAAALTWAAIGLLGYLVYLVVQPFLMPLGWSCVLAVLIYPVFTRLARHVGVGRAAALSAVIAVVLVTVPVVAVTNAFAREAIEIARATQEAFAGGRTTPFERAWSLLVRRVPMAARVNIADLSTTLLQRAANFLMSQSGGILANVAVFLLDLVLALFATFFLLRDSDTLMRAIRRLLPLEPAAREEFITQTRDLITAGVTSSAIVASLQGLLGGLAFLVVGISSPLFWGVVMAFACLLPFGAWVIWLPAAIFLAASGAMTKALVLLGLGVGVVSMVDNVVRPLLLSERVHMNGLVILVSLLGGLNVFGLLGIVLGPIVVVTALSLVRSYIDSRPNDGTPTLT
jgi:predicted PurR-regulated permease PerM